MFIIAANAEGISGSALGVEVTIQIVKTTFGIVIIVKKKLAARIVGDCSRCAANKIKLLFAAH